MSSERANPIERPTAELSRLPDVGEQLCGHLREAGLQLLQKKRDDPELAEELIDIVLDLGSTKSRTRNQAAYEICPYLAEHLQLFAADYPYAARFVRQSTRQHPGTVVSHPTHQRRAS